MGNVSLMILQKDCIGCHACEVACKQEHGLDVGQEYIKVIERAPFYIPIYCHHCANPPCMDSCPVDAIFVDELGMVRLEKDLCFGCMACIPACPFGAIQYDEKSEAVLMCNLCYERLKKGEEPACSMACPTRCILWGDMKTISQEIERRLLQEQGLN